jgi:hypothetical protein
LFVPAVWWTIARRMRDAITGRARTISSFARQPCRVTIAGVPADAVARTGCETTRESSS